MNAEEARIDVRLQHLRRWLEVNFGSVSGASERLGKSRSYFGQYFNRRVIPSRRVLSVLEPYGFDYEKFELGFYPGSMGLAGEDFKRNLQRSRTGSETDALPHSTHELSVLWDHNAILMDNVRMWSDLSSVERDQVIKRVLISILTIQAEIRRDARQGDESDFDDNGEFVA